MANANPVLRGFLCGSNRTVLLLVTVLLCGCGVSGSDVPAGPSPHTAVSSAPATATSSTSPSPAAASDPSADASGSSFGVERIHWPATLKGARTVLNLMPMRLVGQTRQLFTDPRDKEFTSVTYGDNNSVVVSGEQITAERSHGKPEPGSANNSLSAMFGIGLGCVKGSYRGTAPRPAYPAGGPGVTRKPLSRNVWFSCTIDGAEGDDSFTGNAVGWTSHKTAWLVVGQDKKSTQALVDALRQAPQ
jgi:hypothetical protein